MDADAPPAQGERHILAAEEELRLEIGFQPKSTCTVVLQKGSCELFGVELALGKPYVLSDGGYKLAFFTWYGCVIDVDCENIEISYTSDETNCNVAYVNTHAQLEALRDEAMASGTNGPRVLVCGPQESGKSSLVKILNAYACKLGRTPLWVDLDPADSGLSVPGTLAVCPMTRSSVTIESYASTGLPPGTASPLALWHGSTAIKGDLFKTQVTALGHRIDKRLQADDWERASGILVNTHGDIQDEGYQLLLHAVKALKISVVLVMGHDRLYSMMRNSVRSSDSAIHVIKIPRSGGVVSRNAAFLRQSRSRSMKRYFYGDMVEAPQIAKTASSHPSTPHRVPQLTPFLLQLPFDKLTLYKFTSLSLSASLLPVAAAQTTEPVQLSQVQVTEQLQHALLAVCHPHAVAAYQESGKARDLYEAGVAGFVAVERVLMEAEMLHLLSPCAGSLPSYTLLVGDITWLE